MRDTLTLLTALAALATIAGAAIAGLVAWKQWPQLKAFFARPTFAVGFRNDGDQTLQYSVDVRPTWEGDVSTWHHIDVVIRNTSDLTASNLLASAIIDAAVLVRINGMTTGGGAPSTLTMHDMTMHPHTESSFSFDVALNRSAIPKSPASIQVTIYHPNSQPVLKLLSINFNFGAQDE